MVVKWVEPIVAGLHPGGRDARAGGFVPMERALGQVLEESITIVPDQTTALGLGVEGEQFVLKR